MQHIHRRAPRAALLCPRQPTSRAKEPFAMRQLTVANRRFGSHQRHFERAPATSAMPPIVLQKPLKPGRRFSRLKPTQAKVATKSDSGPITEVTDELSARSCDPPHPYTKNAPTAQKFSDQRCKWTFATVSANNGLMHCNKVHEVQPVKDCQGGEVEIEAISRCFLGVGFRLHTTENFGNAVVSDVPPPENSYSAR